MHTSEARKRPQLSLQELYQVNWFLGALLALLSTWTAFYLVLPHVLLTSLLIGISILRPQIPAALPRILWQAVPFLLVILLAIDLHLSVEPVPALIRLNVLLILYRCLAFRRKREDLQLIVLCLFLVIIAGVLTVALTFVIQILLFTAVAMAFLFNITLMEEARDGIAPREVWRDFTWARFTRKIWSLCDAGFLVVAGITFASVVGFSVLLFLMIPRFDINSPIPFLGMMRSAQTGFSESIQFGDVTDIRNNGRVALRVEVSSRREIPADPYWRLLVLDDYADGRFHVSRAVLRNVRTQRKLSGVKYSGSLIAAEEPPDADNLWTFYLEPGVARYLPLTGRFERLRLKEPRNLLYMPPFHVLGTGKVSSSMLVYQVENMDFSGEYRDPNFGRYTLDYEWYPEIDMFFEQAYMNYPDTTVALPPDEADVEYLESVVEAIADGDELAPEEFARRATSYLKERHGYSMSYSVPPGKRDHVVRWLQSRQPGHCEVFAASLILLCRTAGIPARAVTGFRGGTWNTYENYFMVRYSDAHAWVEIFDGEGKWLRFDPTPGGDEITTTTAAEVAESGVDLDSSFAAYLDSLRILWYRRIVSFDQKSQFELWSAIKEGYRKIDVRQWWKKLVDSVGSWMSAPWDAQRMSGLIGFAGAGGLLFFLLALCARRDRFGLFPGRYGGDGIRRKAGEYLRRLQSLSVPQVPVEEEGDAVLRSIRLDLQRLRYGPAERREEPQSVFRRARQYLRGRR